MRGSEVQLLLSVAVYNGNNESAKMATDKGVIQGYTGVAAVDAKHQIIVGAQAHGTGCEQALLMPMVDATAAFRNTDTLITADSGFHNKDNIVALDAMGVNALIADTQMRQRDERFDGQTHHKNKPDPLHDKSKKSKKKTRYTPADFNYDAQARTCTCPAGQSLYRHGSHCVINGRPAICFQGALRICLPCTHRERCLRTPHKTQTRQVTFFGDKPVTEADRLVQQMKTRIDSDEGKALYGKRFATVETRVWQSAREQTTQSLHLPWPRKGERTMVAVLSCPQYREDSQQSVCSMMRRGFTMCCSRNRPVNHT